MIELFLGNLSILAHFCFTTVMSGETAVKMMKVDGSMIFSEQQEKHECISE